MPLGLAGLPVLRCLGLGALAVRTLLIGDDLEPGEHAALSFAVGLGPPGWLVFPLGIAGQLNDIWLLGVLVAGAGGAVLLRQTAPPSSLLRPTTAIPG